MPNHGLVVLWNRSVGVYRLILNPEWNNGHMKIPVNDAILIVHD